MQGMQQYTACLRESAYRQALMFEGTATSKCALTYTFFRLILLTYHKNRRINRIPSFLHYLVLQTEFFTTVQHFSRC
jgi:hypothetical protein